MSNFKKNNGFTLVELLAVIVILAIILAIAVPMITRMIDNSKKQSFESNAKLLLKSIQYKLMENSSFDVSAINATSVENLLNIDADNYSLVYVRNNAGQLYTTLKGAGQFDGLSVSGSFDNIVVQTTEKIVTAGLIQNLDAANAASFVTGDTTWYDVSGSGNNGTLYNGVGHSAVDGSFSFDGVDDYITLPRSIADDFSIEFFFKSSQGIGTTNSWYQGAGLIDAEMSGVTNDFGVTLNSLGRVLAGTGNPDTFIYSTTGFNNNVVHHVAFTRVKSTGLISLYVDGVFQMSATGGTTSLTAPTRITIGRLQTNLYSFSGKIYLARLYNRALTQSEIQQNFDANRGRYGI